MLDPAALPKRYVKITIGGRSVRVLVRGQLYAEFLAEFVSPRPGHRQKRRFALLMELLETAYQQGQHDGRQTGGP
jgi:hypothetical protein